MNLTVHVIERFQGAAYFNTHPRATFLEHPQIIEERGESLRYGMVGNVKNMLYSTTWSGGKVQANIGRGYKYFMRERGRGVIKDRNRGDVEGKGQRSQMDAKPKSQRVRW